MKALMGMTIDHGRHKTAVRKETCYGIHKL